jgi:hypothetical protein
MRLRESSMLSILNSYNCVRWNKFLRRSWRTARWFQRTRNYGELPRSQSLRRRGFPRMWTHEYVDQWNETKFERVIEGMLYNVVLLQLIRYMVIIFHIEAAIQFMAGGSTEEKIFFLVKILLILFGYPGETLALFVHMLLLGRKILLISCLDIPVKHSLSFSIYCFYASPCSNTRSERNDLHWISTENSLCITNRVI